MVKTTILLRLSRQVRNIAVDICGGKEREYQSRGSEKDRNLRKRRKCEIWEREVTTSRLNLAQISVSGVLLTNFG